MIDKILVTLTLFSRSRRHFDMSKSMVSERYLLNQLMDLDQIRKDTLLGKWKLVIRFW